MTIKEALVDDPVECTYLKGQRMTEIVSKFSTLKIEQVEITSTTLGAGSYGEVVEAVWMNTPCAAKKLHRVFRILPPKQHPTIVEKFLRECETWSNLRHPHIVLFLGIVYEVESPLPVIIMEKMDTTLYSFVMERPSEDFPLYRKGSVLLQVALALCYLHNQGLIHRDLTPNNILLDLESFKAKVTDFGVTSFVSSGRIAQTSAPGSPAFMPPEASGANPRYDNKLDTFSYGNVVLFVTSKHWPEPEYPTRTVNGQFRALTEFERRAEYAEHMSSEERRLFLGIIKNCLENNPERRPSSKEIVEEMNKITSQIPVEERLQPSVSTESTDNNTQRLDCNKLAEVSMCRYNTANNILLTTLLTTHC